MKLRKFNKGHGLKALLMSMAGIAAFLLIVSIVFATLISVKRDNKLDDLIKAFNSISDELEFNGYSETVSRKVKEYSLLCGEKVNVILTDRNGKVIYHLNNAYMPELDYFSILHKKGMYYVSIIDSQQNVRYTAYPDFTITYQGDRFSSIDRQLDMIANRIQENREAISDEEYMGNDLAARTVYMQYSFIGSKGYNLFSVAAADINSLVATDDSINILKNAERVLEPLAGFIYMLFWLLLPVWTYLDAQERGFKAPLWALLTLLANVVGLVVYLVVRPDFVKCKNCGSQLNSKFITCPHCGTLNRELCASCRQVIEEDWIACPFCGHIKDTGAPADPVTSESPEGMLIAGDTEGAENA